MMIGQWWSRGRPGMRTRRRLLVLSAPVALVLVLAIVKIVSAVIAGNAAATAFADRDNEALRGAVDALNVVNIVEPAKASFAAGTLAVLERPDRGRRSRVLGEPGKLRILRDASQSGVRPRDARRSRLRGIGW